MKICDPHPDREKQSFCGQAQPPPHPQAVLEQGLLTTGNRFAFLLKREPDYTPVSLPLLRPDGRAEREQEVQARLMQSQGYGPRGKGKVGKKRPQP